MIDHFGSHTFKINSKLFKGAYPVIADLYGDDRELAMEIKIKNPTVNFGKGEDDVTIEFEFDFGIKFAGDMNFLIYDELKMTIAGDILFDQEVLIGELSTLRIQQAGQNAGQRVLPIFNSLDLKQEHYDTFMKWTRNWESTGL